MVASLGFDPLERLAQDVYEVARRLSLAAPAERRRGALSDGEFLTLAMLDDNGIMVVGDMQRRLGVRPAQMSRIIRSLEHRPEAMLACRINDLDKRKIDVTLTEEGRRALDSHRRRRMEHIVEVLNGLSDDDREGLAAVVENVRDILQRKSVSGFLPVEAAVPA